MLMVMLVSNPDIHYFSQNIMSKQPNFLTNPNPSIPVDVEYICTNDGFRIPENDDRLLSSNLPNLHEVCSIPLLLSWLSRDTKFVNCLQKVFGVRIEDIKIEAYLSITSLGGYRHEYIPLKRIATSATIKQWRAQIVSGRLQVEAPCFCTQKCRTDQPQGHRPVVDIVYDLRTVISYHGQQIKWTPTCNMIPKLRSGPSDNISINNMMVDVRFLFKTPPVLADFSLRLELTSIDNISKLRRRLKNNSELLKLLTKINVDFGHDFYWARLRIGMVRDGKEDVFTLDDGDGPSALLAQDHNGQYYVKGDSDLIDPENKRIAEWMAEYGNGKLSQQSLATDKITSAGEQEAAGELYVVFDGDNAIDEPGATASALIRNKSYYRDNGQTEEDFQLFLAGLTAIRERDILNDDNLDWISIAEGHSSVSRVPPMTEATARSRLFVRGDEFLCKLRLSTAKQRRISFRRTIEHTMDGVWEATLRGNKH